jgi:alkylation response protein AidB-like acyl-CoA dehydrogenase
MTPQSKWILNMADTLSDAPPRTGWRALAAQLGAGFAARAAALDAVDGFAAENVTELKAARVYAAAVPAELGGGDATISELSDLLREMARHCPATALMLAMHTHNVAVAAWRWRHQNAPTDGLLRRVAAEQCVLISTGGNDWLGSSGTATKVDGGYRIEARKPFSSGQPVGDLINTSAVLDDPAEGPLVLHFMVPVTTAGVRIQETWKTLGMRASGSNDILLEGVFVPDTAIGARRPKGVWNPLFHTVAMVAFPLVYSVYLGVAEAARDLAVKGVPEAARHDPFVQVAVGAMDTTLATARMAVADMVTAAAGQPGPETTNRTFIGRQIAGTAAIRTVEQAMELAGGRAFFRAAGLERLFRDVQAARYHPLKAADQQLLTGRLALGVPIDG